MTISTHIPALPFELGTTHSHAGLSLIPLFPLHEPKLAYIGLDEAFASGLAVTEVDDAGSVNSLAVQNPTIANVLLFEGEELVGAKQNRVLERTVLVAAQSKTVIAVNCVERGRWGYRSRDFRPAPRTAYVRARVESRKGGQSAVWADIAAKSHRLAAASPSDAAEEMYVQRAHSLDEYATNLARQDGQCGAIVCLGGSVVCVDYVSRSDVYAGLYAKLLRGYALDAIERPQNAPVPEQYVKVLLRRIARAQRTPARVTGLGEEHDLRGTRISGSELTVGGETVALSVFPEGRA